MMILDKNSWHARLYSWTAWNWLRFRGYDPDLRRHADRFENLSNTNLCQYIRTLFIQLPLLILLHGLLAVAVGYALFWHPIALFGSYSWLSVIGISLCVAAAAIAVIGLIYLGFVSSDKVKSAIETYIDKLANTPPGIIRLTIQWFKDRHDNICSIIQLRSTEENSND